jgi:hypothetical protein
MKEESPEELKQRRIREEEERQRRSKEEKIKREQQKATELLTATLATFSVNELKFSASRYG